MTALNQFTNINNYYSEYLELINKYKNYTRHSLFCRYYNINLKNSITKNNSTISPIYNGIIFDIYDMTPVHKIGSILNSNIIDKTKQGLTFDGTSKAVIYTIENPNIKDLITFPYNNQSNEIYLVKNISTSLSTFNTNKNKFVELDIEYAYTKELNDLQILNHYYYLPNLNKYLLKNDYIEYINLLKLILEDFKNKKFNDILELYYEDDDNIYYQNNKLYYDFLIEYNYDIFIKVPFGIKNNNLKIKKDFYNNNLLKKIEKINFFIKG